MKPAMAKILHDRTQLVVLDKVAKSQNIIVQD